MVLNRHGRLGGRSRLAALAAAAVLVVTPVAAGCSDDGGGNGGGSSPTPTRTQMNEPADPAAAKAEITKNWTAFFNAETPVEERVRVLENGEQMRPVLIAFAADPNAARVSAKVGAIAFTSAEKAAVTYDLLIAGTPAVPNSKGTSVLQDDVWKVSVQTLCALVNQSGNAVPGC
ncbi:hypothetical protein ACGFMM_19595 [Streptomyces sp. NPDC048604]|uniref:hypothetical protein n=1 Tax=Streptomyces sp. NPDC048604 TaxID=3365578 RepID=UPI003723E2A5